MTRFEIYGVVLLVIALAIGAAYLKGCHDTERRINTEQLAANAKSLQDAADAATRRAAADDAARQRAQQYIATLDQGIANVRSKFAGLPAVVVDDRGCERVNDLGRLRWNEIELLPTGPALNPASIPPQPVPAGAVPPP